ncbi:MAG: molybdopterin-dependent oxidoreductase [Acidobacteriota bacterium]
MPMINIDGKEIHAQDRQMIIQAADEHGIEIPRFCYHPDLPIDGNCRMCLVELEKAAKPVIACNTEVKEGMVIRTVNTSAAIREAVRGVLELLLINHPIDCPVCDQAGECSLQDFYMDYGLYSSMVTLDEKVKKRKAIGLGPLVVLDQERCVHCSRCIRFTETITKTGELQFFNRGDHTVIGTLEDRPLDNPYSGNVVDLCPVGALTSRDFRFRCRVWLLQYTDSICAGCSTGCNLRIDHQQERIYRLVPRRNPAINHSWLCDEGRMSFHTLEQGTRLKTPQTRINGSSRATISWEEAFAEIEHNIKVTGMAETARRIGIASASATNETLYLFRDYFHNVLGSDEIDFRLNDEDRKVTTREDEILRHLDKHPNTMGALLLRLQKDSWNGLTGLLNSAQEKAIGLLILLYYRPLVGDEDIEVKAQLSKLTGQAGYSIVLSPHIEEWMQSAHMLLPVAAWSEEEGTYTNFQARVQYVSAASRPPELAMPAWRVFYDLLTRAGEANVGVNTREIFARLAATVPQYLGLDYNNLISVGKKVYPPEGRHAYSAQEA